jgi:hypothetical protein
LLVHLTKHRRSFFSVEPSWPTFFNRCRRWTGRRCCLHMAVRVRGRTRKTVGNCVGQRKVICIVTSTNFCSPCEVFPGNTGK